MAWKWMKVGIVKTSTNLNSWFELQNTSKIQLKPEKSQASLIIIMRKTQLHKIIALTVSLFLGFNTNTPPGQSLW